MGGVVEGNWTVQVGYRCRYLVELGGWELAGWVDLRRYEGEDGVAKAWILLGEGEV